MPKVRRSKKPPPDGWELIEPTLDEIEQKMREGQLSLHFQFFTEHFIVLVGLKHRVITLGFNKF